MKRVAVVGGGVAGLSAVTHLLEIWDARRRAGLAPDPLELVFVAQLVPHEDSEGSGLGGKAMSRSFEGRYDLAHDGMDRVQFYGPGMPWRGTVPHGYHVLWHYPNLRRILGAGADPLDDLGVLRPPGGAGVIASFQANLDDPTPGGPGIGLMGLVDPDRPETATRPVTADLLALRATPVVRPFLALFERLFESATGGIDPFSFADLFYAHEVDLELRLSLILASIQARGLDPERATVRLDGHDVPLTEVEYSVWAEETVSGWARQHPLLRVVPEELLADLGSLGGPLVDVARRLVTDWGARGAVLESLLERDDLLPLFGLLPDGLEARLGQLRRVYVETERVVRALPGALARLAAGRYPIWRTLHFRFAPDATFASPYSFDAAQAVRSLSLCFDTPLASRMWSADGARIQRLWLRLWRRLQALAAENARDVVLRVEEGRVGAIAPVPEGGGVGVAWGRVLGHGFQGAHDLSYPHVASRDASPPPPASPTWEVVDVVIPATGPAHLEALLDADAWPAARAQLAPLRARANVTLELLLWTREPIEWSDAARAGLAVAAITGLEGPFCLLADYRCGLWSPETLAAERPFGPDVPFAGSILESCGGFDDLWASLDRADAYGWPREAKDALRALLADPAQFAEVDQRPRPHDEHHYPHPTADGTWSEARAGSAEGWEDWVVASRWLAWGYLRQLAAIQSLGPRAVRQLAALAARLDPRGVPRAALLQPDAALLGEVRWVVMRNANRRTRFFCPAVGDWHRRPVSGLPLQGAPSVFPAGDWTRNGLDVICMEAAVLSGMRAARGAWGRLGGGALPVHTPEPIRVLPPSQWYTGVDPMARDGS